MSEKSNTTSTRLARSAWTTLGLRSNPTECVVNVSEMVIFFKGFWLAMSYGNSFILRKTLDVISYPAVEALELARLTIAFASKVK